jgi:hypothetical protein
MLLPGLLRLSENMFSGIYSWPVLLKKHGGKVSHILSSALGEGQFYGTFASLLWNKSLQQ